MSHSMMLQDFTTISGPQSSTVIQNEAGWIDVSGYQDACFYLEITACTGVGGQVVNLYAQSSPSKDAAFFDAFASGSTPGSIANFQFTIGTTTVGVQTLKISRWATETVQPLAKHLRWKIVFPASVGSYSITFRLWMTLNQAGY